jgi:hypothetical protein
MPTIARRTVARRTITAASVVAAAVATYACADDARPTGPASSVADAALTVDGKVLRQYGPATRVGNGRARTYILLDHATRAPIELGVALDESAMEGLRGPSHAAPGDDPHAHADFDKFDLRMPAQNPTPYQWVELDWNPGGHEPPGIYDTPHFDFHFYRVSQAQIDAIDPAALGQAQFLAKSGNLPPEAERAPFYIAPAAPGQPISAIPKMGVHWLDVRSPELQGMFGNPAGYRPFTTTFIYGSWDGDFIFEEPMITRAFIMSRKTATAAAERDSVISIPTPAQRRPDGYYPAAYHVTWDEQTREYRVGLQQFAKH